MITFIYVITNLIFKIFCLISFTPNQAPRNNAKRGIVIRPGYIFISVPLTLFFPMFHFDPPENIRKPLVFRGFQGDEKGTLGRKRLSFIFLLFFTAFFYTLALVWNVDLFCHLS